MAYSSQYSADDLSSITIDLVAKGLVVILSFATLIVLIWLFVYLKKKLR